MCSRNGIKSSRTRKILPFFNQPTILNYREETFIIRVVDLEINESAQENAFNTILYNFLSVGQLKYAVTHGNFFYSVKVLMKTYAGQVFSLFNFGHSNLTFQKSETRMSASVLKQDQNTDK